MFPQYFTVPQLSQLSGLPTRTIHDWVARGAVPCLNNPAPGSGKDRFFGPQAAFAVAVAGQFVDAGVGPTAIRKIVQHCAKTDFEKQIKQGYRYLAANSHQVFAMKDPKKEAVVLAGGKETFALVMLDLAAFYDRFLERIGAKPAAASSSAKAGKAKV